MTYTPPKILSFEEFITEYGDNTRYELIDGELRDMEPTGPHEAVAGNIAGRIYVEIFHSQFNWIVPKTCLIKPPAAEATALRPDVIVLDQEKLSSEPLWHKEPIICNGSTIKLVAEVVSQCVARVPRVEATDEPVRVSTNWQDDYARKVEEYAFLNIPEYWIVDFRGLGGLQFIGNPKQPTFTVCQLVNGVYEQHQYRLGDTISSDLLPNLEMTLNDIMPI
ncbi:MAG: Uma2 family endonuclease [Nostoc sp. LLA-1]|nr:Uma2 family endonuclease [Cyanocohniella sp. LLY]